MRYYAEPQRWIRDTASFTKIWDKQPAALAIMSVQLYPQQTARLGSPRLFSDTQYIVVSKP
ncbi:MAG: hypothetical protein IPP36_06130 [Nitrosomonadales bacterium]|nr:hypothetical protein [Nitrosomonadales bacterium]